MAPLETPLEQENQLWRFWRLLRKRLWMIVAVYVVIAFTLSLDAMQEPRLYRATAQLLVEHENPKVISFEEAIGKQYVHDSNVPSSSYYQTQFKILQSRSLARRVIRALNLQSRPAFMERQSAQFSAASASPAPAPARGRHAAYQRADYIGGGDASGPASGPS